MFTRKVIFAIVTISLLGSAGLAYGLSTEFLFNFSVIGTPLGTTSNSTHIFVVNASAVTIFDLSGTIKGSFLVGGATKDIAVNATHIFVVRDDEGDIKLFEHSDTSIVNATWGGFTAPRGIALNDTHVFVADTGNNEVVILDSSGVSRDSIPEVVSTLDEAVNVAVDSNGRIIVLDDGGTTAIDIYDPSGNYLNSPSSVIGTPIGVDVDSNNRIIVSDVSTMGVLVFDSSGNQLTTFGGSGTGDGQFSLIGKLSVDSNDRIIIPDDAGSNRIQVFAYSSESSTSGGGSANKHKTAPTSGNDWNTHNPLVKDGVSVNGKSFDITNNWWTPFEQIQIGTSSMHTFTAKTFAQNGGLMVQEFAFGIPQIGEYQNAEAMVEVHYNYDKSIKDIVVVQDTEVIMISSINATTAQVSCDDSSVMCYQTSVSMIFNEPLKDKVYAIKAFDMSRRSMMPHYFNEGINIVGEIVNPLPIKTIPGTIKGEGLITITQVEKYSDLWIAEDGRVFETYGESDSIRLTNVETKRVTDTGHVNSRTHSAWDMLIEHQNEMATKYFDSSKIQNPDMGFIAPILDDNGIDKRTETLQKLNWR